MNKTILYFLTVTVLSTPAFTVKLMKGDHLHPATLVDIESQVPEVKDQTLQPKYKAFDEQKPNSHQYIGYSEAERQSKGRSIPTKFLESDSNIEDASLDRETEEEVV